MADIWSDVARWEIWRVIEVLVCEAWGREGRIPSRAMAKIRAKSKVWPDRVAQIEAEIKHDVIAFVTAMAETVGAEGRYLHLGLTSSDILDTSLAVQLCKSSKLLEENLKSLLGTLKNLTKKYAKTPMMGRSHGIHAEPVTFGLKTATWYAEMKRHLARLREAKKTVAVGKISGAVGTYAQIPPRIEKQVLSKLGLKPETPATQVVSRDRHAFFFNVLAGIAGSIEKIAVEIRHLARTEVGEVAEPFGKGQKGSSAMPHKRNPILSENLTGLARLMRAYSQAANENVALWHERDISHSSVERVIAPDATIVLDFMLHRLNGVLRNLSVYPKRMLENIDATHGVIFSQEVLLALVDAGWSREKAYKRVQSHAMQAMQNGESFESRILQDAMVRRLLSVGEIRKVFSLERKLKEVPGIIKRALR